MATHVFPEKPESEKAHRKRGVRKPQMAFRAPADLEEFIEESMGAGYTQTDVVVKMLRTAMSAAKVLGSDWEVIEDLARTARSTPGEVLGRLAKIGLVQERKGKK